MTEPLPALLVEGLAYAHPGGAQVLYGVDLQIAAGERVALLGPNGAGKTTLVLHLNGVLTPGAGPVVVGGLAVVPANHREVRRRVGFVFTDPDAQLFMATVRDRVAFGTGTLGLRGHELDAAVPRPPRPVGLVWRAVR